MPVRVRFITDPGCVRSWTVEPVVRKLMVEFGEELQWTWVMGGLARSYDQGYADAGAGTGGSADPFPGLIAHWLEVAGESRMPLDPRLWSEGPIASTYPACMAVKAAAEQGAGPACAYLRVLREGLMCFRRKLDTTEALVEEARRARLDVERFRRDLASHAIVEAFGADLEEARAVPAAARAEGLVEVAGDGRERVSFPTAEFSSEAGQQHFVFGARPYENYRAAAEAAGARPLGEDPPGALAALRRFGSMAAAEVEAVCDMPEPRAAAELWRMATEWKVRPVRVLTGHLWEAV